MMKWSADSWLPDFRRTYSYDSLKNQIFFLRTICSKNEWIDDYRTFYEYDFRRNLLSSYGETWGDSIWLPSFHIKYTYEDSNNTSSRCEKRWIKGTVVYVDSVSFSYDTNNNVISKILHVICDSMYHYEGVFSDIFEYVYSENMNILSIFTKKYNEVGLSQQLLDTFLYDENERLNNAVFHIWNVSQWIRTDKNKVLVSITDSKGKREFIATQCSHLAVDYFIGSSVSDNKISSGNIIISPNPASDYLTISLKPMPQTNTISAVIINLWGQ